MYIDKREKNMLISQFFLMITPSPRAHPNFPIQRFDPTPMTCAFRHSNICKISILPACAAWCSGAKPHEATTFCRSSVHNGWSNLGKKRENKGKESFLFVMFFICILYVSTVFKDLLNKFGFLGLKILGFCDCHITDHPLVSPQSESFTTKNWIYTGQEFADGSF